jgi:hypothetical protein
LIRKEHVDVAMEFSRYPRALEHALHEGRRPACGGPPIPQSSTACGHRVTRSTLF